MMSVPPFATLSATVMLLGLAACGKAPSAAFSPDGGQRAQSRDETLSYVVSSDSERLQVVDKKSQRTVAEVPVGRAPERVVVGPDDTLYVSNRGSRSVSVIRRGKWKEAARIPVGVEPASLSVSPDGRTLLVVNRSSLQSSEVGTLTAVDTRSLKPKWDLPLGPDPRELSFLEDGDAMVTLDRPGEAVQVDLSQPDAPRVVGRVSSSEHPAFTPLGTNPAQRLDVAHSTL